MQTKRFKIKNLIALLLIAVLATSISGCSGTTIKVSICDAYVTTELEAKAPFTVESALKQAEITIADGDRITPDLSASLSDGDKILIERRYSVSVLHNGKKAKQIDMVGGTIADAITAAGIEITDKSAANYDKDRLLSNGLEINVVELSKVFVTADGCTTDYNTSAKTVGEFLKEHEITLSENDRISKDVTAKITDNMKIKIERVTTKQETITQPIKFKTIKKQTSSLAAGKTKITQKGKNGEKEITYSITYVDGKEESREVINEKVITKPTNQLVSVGKTENKKQNNGKKVISRQYYDDCDGSGHGVCIVTYSDGTTEQIEY